MIGQDQYFNTWVAVFSTALSMYYSWPLSESVSGTWIQLEEGGFALIKTQKIVLIFIFLHDWGFYALEFKHKLKDSQIFGRPSPPERPTDAVCPVYNWLRRRFNRDSKMCCVNTKERDLAKRSEDESWHLSGLYQTVLVRRCAAAVCCLIATSGLILSMKQSAISWVSFGESAKTGSSLHFRTNYCVNTGDLTIHSSGGNHIVIKKGEIKLWKPKDKFMKFW